MTLPTKTNNNEHFLPCLPAVYLQKEFNHSFFGNKITLKVSNFPCFRLGISIKTALPIGHQCNLLCIRARWGHIQTASVSVQGSHSKGSQYQQKDCRSNEDGEEGQ